VTPFQHKDSVSRMDEALTRFREMKQAKLTTESIECMDDSLCEESKASISPRESSAAIIEKSGSARGSPNRKRLQEKNSFNMAPKMLYFKGVQGLNKFFKESSLPEFKFESFEQIDAWRNLSQYDKQSFKYDLQLIRNWFTP
jgi:hypothetical protein